MPPPTRSASLPQRQRCTMPFCRRSLAVLFIVNLHIVTCVQYLGTPDFQFPMTNVTVPKGRDASFTCTVNRLGGHRVAWIKADTKAILAIHEHVITNNARLSVSHNDHTWTLSIKDAKPEDRGTYMCQVNTDPMRSQSAYLEVVIPPDIIYEETSGDVMVPEGGNAKLTCKAHGYPKPKIEWRREGNDSISLKGSDNSVTKVWTAVGEVLSFSHIRRSEMGGYLCIASNSVPPSVSKRMMLQVHFRPLIEVSNQLVGAPVRTNATLSCRVEASPKPINYWTRESGEMIINNDKYEMTEEITNMYSARMRLTIRNLHKSDFMGYKCISKNSLGDAESVIRLYEIKITQYLSDNNGGSESSSDEDNGNQLNSVYQSSLQESGSTSQPRGDSKYSGGSSSRSIRHLGSLMVFLVVWTMA